MPTRSLGDVGALFRRAEPIFAREGGADRTAYLARAPGRLDVMGGIAEYTGALVLGATMADGVSVVAQRRDDADIVVYEADGEDSYDTHRVVFEPSLFDGPDVADFRGALARIATGPTEWARPVGGVLHALRISKKIDGRQPGATIVVGGSLPRLVDLSWTSSAAVATLLAICRCWDLALDATECAHLAMRAHNDTLDAPCGIAAAFCALYGQPGTLTPVDCQNNVVRAALPLPPGVAVVGIDCGSKLALANEKYVRARVAAFMGRKYIERIASQSGRSAPWNGSLAQLSAADYVTVFRDRIPVKIKGSDFLSRFSEIADPLTTVDPDVVYRVRSRTEHHIYEAARTHEFAERLSNCTRNHDTSALVEAGERMLGSHWSYGQRCGLGSVETDKLVKALRERGVQAGIYGAKISAQGAGGVVVVLIRDDDATRVALRDVMREYEQATSLQTTLFEGGSQGALHAGIWED